MFARGLLNVCSVRCLIESGGILPRQCSKIAHFDRKWGVFHGFSIPNCPSRPFICPGSGDQRIAGFLWRVAKAPVRAALVFDHQGGIGAGDRGELEFDRDRFVVSNDLSEEFVSLVQAGRQCIFHLNFFAGVRCCLREGKGVLIKIVTGCRLPGHTVPAGTDCADEKRKGLLKGQAVPADLRVPQPASGCFAVQVALKRKWCSTAARQKKAAVMGLRRFVIREPACSFN